METYTKHMLSGSTNGKAIKVVQTSTAGTLLHTAVAGTADKDEVWLWAVNNDTVDHLLTIEWGEATAPDGNIIGNVPAKSGLYKVVPGFPLQNGLEIRAFADAANVVSVHGFVNRLVIT
jgi:hypothetical protein